MSDIITSSQKTELKESLREIRYRMRDLQREDYPSVNKEMVDAILMLSHSIADIELRLDLIERQS